MKVISRLIRESGGQDLIEYALLTGIISAVLVLALSALGPKVSGPYAVLNAGLATGSGSPGGANPTDPGSGNPNPGNGNPGNGNPNPGNGNPNPGNGNPGNGNPNPGNGNPNPGGGKG